MVEKLFLTYILLLPIMRALSLPLFKEKIQYADLIFIALFISWLRKKYKEKLSLENVPFLGLLFLTAAAFLLSFKNSVNLVGSATELAGFLYLLLLYFMINQICLTEKLYWKTLRTWNAVAVIVAALGIFSCLAFFLFDLKSPFLDSFVTYKTASRHLVNRIRSTFLHPNMLASYLHVSIIFAFISITQNKITKNRKLFFGFSIIVFLICSILTKSRLLAGTFLSIFLISLWWQKKRTLKYISCILFVITVCLLICSVASIIWWILPVDFNLDSSQNTFSVILNSLNNPYYFQHKAGWDMFKDHPLLGVGLGNFNYWMVGYINWQEAREPYRMMDPDLTRFYKKGLDPHSTYLGLLSETGILGFSLILAFFVLFIIRISKFISTKESPFARHILWCFFAGICGFAWNAIYIEILTMRHFWFLLAMGIVFMKKQIIQQQN